MMRKKCRTCYDLAAWMWTDGDVSQAALCALLPDLVLPSWHVLGLAHICGVWAEEAPWAAGHFCGVTEAVWCVCDGEAGWERDEAKWSSEGPGREYGEQYVFLGPGYNESGASA
mgnify:CR=1 FL=1